MAIPSPWLSGRELRSRVIADPTIWQIGDLDGMPSADETFSRQFAHIELITAIPHFTRQADECRGPIRIDAPALFVPIVRYGTVPAIILIEAPTFHGLTFGRRIEAGDVHEWGNCLNSCNSSSGAVG